MYSHVLIGDCREQLKTLPDASVNCCVTSPPYFGLRDYGVEGQLGLEPTPEEFVENLVGVFREVRRVLRDDGTLWLNLGDSYIANPNPDKNGDKLNLKGRARFDRPNTKKIPGLKQKDLIGIPWRVALALQADGWYLRQDIIWHKPNPMPESVKDRCTKAHEYIFLLSKSKKYYFDAEAIKEPTTGQQGAAASFKRGTKETLIPNQQVKQHRLDRPGGVDTGLKNRRSVWSVTTKPYKEAHFATFPPQLIEPCILAGCPEGGIVLDPFGGSGTTAGVAEANNRLALLCELKPEFAALIPDRVAAIRKASK